MNITELQLFDTADFQQKPAWREEKSIITEDRHDDSTSKPKEDLLTQTLSALFQSNYEDQKLASAGVTLRLSSPEYSDEKCQGNLYR